ncbi:MAG: O-antigen ligase family protein, partial [Chloroflexota bacterium]|nr:O-antigen ligase family protein [Chloroflexota bacterium]
VRDEKSFRAVLFILLLAVCANALHSVRQFLDQENTNFFLVHTDVWQGVEALDVPKDALIRVTGYFNNPNVLASYLILVLPVVACFPRYSNTSNWMTSLLVGISGAALLLTFSRSAVIALLLALGMAVALSRAKPLFAIPFVLLIAITLLNPWSIDRLVTGVERIAPWSAAVNMIVHHPIFGVGLGNFRAFALQASVDAWHAHNLFLHIAAEAGIIASILLMGIFGVAIKWALDLAREKSWARPIGLALAVSFIAFVVASIFDVAYNVDAISYTFWFLLGLLVAAQRIYAHKPLQLPAEAAQAPEANS